MTLLENLGPALPAGLCGGIRGGWRHTLWLLNWSSNPTVPEPGAVAISSHLAWPTSTEAAQLGLDLSQGGFLACSCIATIGPGKHSRGVGVGVEDKTLNVLSTPRPCPSLKREWEGTSAASRPGGLALGRLH